MYYDILVNENIIGRKSPGCGFLHYP